jgi:hypothetical protein
VSEAWDITRAVRLAFPLRGEWTAFNTPAERIPSHGTDYFAQRYAFDLARLDMHRQQVSPHGFWRHGLGILRTDSCFGWAQPVLAPFNGRVVAAADGWPDRLRLSFFTNALRAFVFPRLPTGDDYRPLTGNYIFLEGADGIAMLAHLKHGSVRVGVGERVLAGQALALVGNSGNSMMPHLHFQLMDGIDPFSATALPCKFATLELWDGADWNPASDVVPDRLETVRAR